jgi:hypothetical protein
LEVTSGLLTVRSYDFSALQAAAAMQQSWAALFADACAPGWGWDSLSTTINLHAKTAAVI